MMHGINMNLSFILASRSELTIFAVVYIKFKVNIRHMYTEMFLVSLFFRSTLESCVSIDVSSVSALTSPSLTIVDNSCLCFL